MLFYTRVDFVSECLLYAEICYNLYTLQSDTVEHKNGDTCGTVTRYT